MWDQGQRFVREAFSTTGPGSVFGAECDHQSFQPGACKDHCSRRRDLRQAEYMAPSISVGIKYSDIGDEQRTQSVLRLERGLPSDRVFIVRRLTLHACDDNWIRATDRSSEPGLRPNNSEHQSIAASPPSLVTQRSPRGRILVVRRPVRLTNLRRNVRHDDREGGRD